MLKILQARLQQYVNHELPNVHAGLEKAEEQEIKLPTSAGSPPGSAIHGIFQARVLEWGAIAFSWLTLTEALIS